MFAARDQENLVLSQHGAALKQQQGQINPQQLPPKTPGAKYPKTPVKVALNDENTKGLVAGRSRGNQNTLPNTKTFKPSAGASFTTPVEPRVRAVLGDKTTNAKATGLPPTTVIAKNAVREIEKSQAKAPTTVKPKLKHVPEESKRLQVHAEEAEGLSEEKPEYCPPRPKDLPYESDVFPDGVLTFDGLKPKDFFRGYYQHYFNPVDENGVSRADRELEEKNKKARKEADKRILRDLDEFDWSIGDVPGSKDFLKNNDAPKPAPQPTPISDPMGRTIAEPRTRKKPALTLARNAASAFRMDDTTKSMQRRTAPSLSGPTRTQKPKPLTMPGTNSSRQAITQPALVSRKTSMEMKAAEANSRTTIGYNRGRATSSALSKGTKKVAQSTTSTAFPGTETTTSKSATKSATSARITGDQASAAAAEDERWKERVPFLSIFSPGDDEEVDLCAGGLSPTILDEEDEVHLNLLEA